MLQWWLLLSWNKASSIWSFRGVCTCESSSLKLRRISRFIEWFQMISSPYLFASGMHVMVVLIQNETCSSSLKGACCMLKRGGRFIWVDAWIHGVKVKPFSDDFRWAFFWQQCRIIVGWELILFNLKVVVMVYHLFDVSGRIGEALSLLLHPQVCWDASYTSSSSYLSVFVCLIVFIISYCCWGLRRSFIFSSH